MMRPRRGRIAALLHDINARLAERAKMIGSIDRYDELLGPLYRRNRRPHARRCRRR
jgi:hypothetical protein